VKRDNRVPGIGKSEMKKKMKARRCCHAKKIRLRDLWAAKAYRRRAIICLCWAR
jgi:hypothetical protein